MNKILDLLSIGLILALAMVPAVMAVEENEQKTIIVRNDDIGAWWSTQNAISVMNTIRSMEVPQTIGIVPLTAGGTINLSEDPALLDYLRKIMGDPYFEFGLHGWNHAYNEFGSLTQIEAEERIRKGKEMMAKTIGVTPVTFIPPYYESSDGTLLAMIKLGMNVLSGGPGDESRIIPKELKNIFATTDFVRDWNSVTLFTADEIEKSCQTALDTHGRCVIVVHHHAFTDASNNIDPNKIKVLIDVMTWVKQKESEDGVKLTTLGNWGGDSDTNIVKNSGFESGTASWTFYTSGTGSFTATSPGYEGSNAAKISLSSGGTNIQLYQKGITLEPNTQYRLSFAAYSKSGHDLTVRLFKHGAPYTVYAPDFAVNLGTSWQTFSTEFTTKGMTGTVNDGRLMFWMAPFAKAGDTYYIDDVRLEKVVGEVGVEPKISAQPADITVGEDQTATFSVVATGTAPLTYQWQKNGVDISGANGASYTTPPTTLGDCGSNFQIIVKNQAGSVKSESATLTIVDPQNRVHNPGFESGKESWVFYTSGTGTFTVISPGYGGSKAAKLSLRSGGSNIQLYQKGINLEPNTRYRLSFVAYSTSGHDVTVRLFKHGSPYTGYGLDFTANLGTNWQTYTTEFTTKGFSGKVNDARLMFWLAPFAKAGDTYYIDDVRLEVVV